MLNTSIEFSISAEDIAAANETVKGNPVGYVINPGPVTTIKSIYKTFPDKIKTNCLFVLVKWMDGTGIFLRYPKYLIKIN